MDFNFDSVPSAIEVQLMNKRPCNVFQVPPITSAAGHKAEDWRGKQIWTGFCRVLMEGSDKCKIKFVNEDNTVFAESAFKNDNYEQYIQRCVDSSRFFAVLLVNPQTGQKANIGVQFPERHDSFDFVGAFDQYRKYYQDEKGTDTHKQEF